MRRQIIILLFLLSTSLVSAQSFPPVLAGDQMVPGDTIEFEMYLYKLHDRSPWSLPGMEGHTFWFGWMFFGIEGTQEQLDLVMDRYATRECQEGGVAPKCYYSDMRYIPDRTATLPWNEDCKCYIRVLDWSWGSSFESVTIDEVTYIAKYTTGNFYVDDGQYFFDFDRTIRHYRMQEFTTQPKPTFIRRLLQRIGRR